MKVKKIGVTILSLLLVFVFTLLAACSSSSSSSESSEKSSGSSQSDPESEKAASDLTGLENNLETIVKTLGGPAVQVKQETQQDSGGSQSGQSSESQQSSSSQQGQGQQQSQASVTSQQDPMDKITPIVDKMHYQWNNLMPAAIKKGVNKNLVNNIDNALNNLSTTAASKNKMNTLLAANQLYAYIPDLYMHIQPKPSPEIKRIRYYSRSAILNSSTANWAQANSDISSLKSVWVLYKNGLSKDQQDTANKLDLSIYELEKVVKERNQSLVNIKGKVEFSNIEALEKATESESTSSGGQSGSQQSSSSQQSGGSK